MLTSLKIFWNNLLMALQELRVNKLRTFLSLLGVTIGIFCIIGVFTLTKSLERNVRAEFSTLGSNVIYIQKWPWNGGGEWWKYWNRPQVNYDEFRSVQQRMNGEAVCAYTFGTGNKVVQSGDNYLQGVNMMAVSEGYAQIQDLGIIDGRFFTNNEANGDGTVIILGYNIWSGLFNSPREAIGKTIQFAGRPLKVIGLLKRYGSGIINVFDYDNSVVVPASFGRQIINDRSDGADPSIMVRANDNISLDELSDELRATMRAVRRLKPRQDDNFALNQLSVLSSGMDSVFGGMNKAGIFIGIFALIVGAFGIANIMFVTVKERTNIIGLKKAIGAKRNAILTEFLIESVLLCLIGGIIGMILVFIVTKLISHSVSFSIYLSPGIVFTGFVISVVTGIVAGYIPAFSASKLDPVVAIRS